MGDFQTEQVSDLNIACPIGLEILRAEGEKIFFRNAVLVPMGRERLWTKTEQRSFAIAKIVMKSVEIIDRSLQNRASISLGTSQWDEIYREDPPLMMEVYELLKEIYKQKDFSLYFHLKDSIFSANCYPILRISFTKESKLTPEYFAGTKARDFIIFSDAPLDDLPKLIPLRFKYFRQDGSVLYLCEQEKSGEGMTLRCHPISPKFSALEQLVNAGFITRIDCWGAGKPLADLDEIIKSLLNRGFRVAFFQLGDMIMVFYPNKDIAEKLESA